MAVDEVDAELETEMLAHLSKVIVPAGVGRQ